MYSSINLLIGTLQELVKVAFTKTGWEARRSKCDSSLIYQSFNIALCVGDLP
jgi:hypothetical protein